MTDFVHLHVHSDFSLQDAAVSVMSLADKAERLGMKYLALTDHGNMFGAMEFLAACKETVINEKGDHAKRKNPLKPIIGCEVYVSPGSRFEKKGTESDNKYHHLILLAMNREGYRNLVKLCSFAYTEGFYYRPRVDEELLARYHGGLICLSACVSGEIPRLIQGGKLAAAEQKARYYRDLFGEDNFYLEIQDHGIPAETLGGTLSQQDINRAIVDISRRTGIPLAATNDVHYLDREDAAAHDILLCIGTGKKRSDEKRKRYYGDQFYFKTGDEMAALFPEYPEAIANTVRIAERCVTDVPQIQTKELPRYLPDFEIPPGFDTADDYLRRLALDGLAKRYSKIHEAGGGPWEEILKREEYELDTIINMGFTGYFLIVADFINWAKERNIPVGPGRGSGAGSIVAYSLRITDIEPLKYNLLFERFLNPERISMPDFDVDFANEGRDEVIRYVTEKYGKERVGQIITFGTLGAKAVIKDVARALEIGIPESEMITKLIPRDPKITLKKAFDGEPKLRELEQNPKYAELFTLARKLEGLNRHSSLHAAGVVIGKSTLHDFVPLYRDPKTEGIATQYTMNHLENCGLVKMDFLGLKTLDVIKRTGELIRRRGGQYTNFSTEDISDDESPEAGAAFKMLGEGKSFEVFQFESDGMQNTLKQAKPGKVEDLIALNALYRPGPMANIPQFIESKNGTRKITYPDPSLEGILKETYGVIVYQEQVMQVARIIAGYSLGQADMLRRAMGKKKKEIIDKERIPFLEGARKQGYSEENAGKIYDILVPFADYGFNKSHAAAYAILAYQTAWLKANFPAEFMAATLTNEIRSADKDKLSECIDEARKMGLSIDPPDINRSDKLFTVVDGQIVYGFLGIKGIGEASSEEIIVRRREGPYRDFLDFLDRVDIKTVGKKAIELLIQTGAFDRLGVPRDTLKGNLERAVEYAQPKQDDRKSGQSSLFEDSGEKEHRTFSFEPFPEMSRAEKLRTEKELIGLYISGHPLDEYKKTWERAVKIDLSRPEASPPGSYTLIGILKNLKPHTTGKGGKMAFADLADYNGDIGLTFFPKTWEQLQDQLADGQIAAFRGKLDYQQEKDQYSFLPETLVPLAEVEALLEQEAGFARQMDEYRGAWKEEVKLDLSRPETAEAKTEYTLIGVLKDLRPFHTQKGNDMASAVLVDYRGEISVTFFPKIWAAMGEKLADNQVIAFKGKVKRDTFKNRPVFYPETMPSLSRLKGKYKAVGPAAGPSADNQGGGLETESLEEFMESIKKTSENREGENPCRELHIRLKGETGGTGETGGAAPADLSPIRDCLVDKPGPCAVYIHVPLREGEQVIRTTSQLSVSAEEAQVEALGRCAAVAKVWRV